METIQPPQFAPVHAAGPKQVDGTCRDKAVAHLSPLDRVKLASSPSPADEWRECVERHEARLTAASQGINVVCADMLNRAGLGK